MHFTPPPTKKKLRDGRRRRRHPSAAWGWPDAVLCVWPSRSNTTGVLRSEVGVEIFEKMARKDKY
jgi:hypothetical protein